MGNFMNNLPFQTKILIPDLLSPLDWFFFAGSLVITFLAIAYGAKQKKKILQSSQKNEETSLLEIILMGRQLTLPLFVATMVSSWYGGIFGVTQIAFEKGVYNFLTQGLFWYLTYFVFAFFLVKKIRSYQAMTLPELVGKMFGPKSAKLSAVLNIFNVIPVVYIISTGLFLQLVIGGELFSCMLLGLILVISYSLWGGFRSDVYSDLVQFFFMCLSVFLVFLFSYLSFGGIDFLNSKLPPSHFHFFEGHHLPSLFVWGFIALSTLVDPNFYQRCFAAQSDQVAKKGIIISTCIWALFDICTTAGGMYARAVLPQASSEHAYLTYALQVLPPGMRGLILAGILATILSTLDSYLIIAGSTFAHDLIPASTKRKKLMYYVGVLLAGLVGLILAQGFDGNIKLVWKTLGSYSAGCLLLPMMLGHFFPGKIKDQQFFAASLLGVLTISIWKLYPHPYGDVIDEFYIGLLTTLVGIIFFGRLPVWLIIRPKKLE